MKLQIGGKRSAINSSAALSPSPKKAQVGKPALTSQSENLVYPGDSKGSLFARNNLLSAALFALGAFLVSLIHNFCSEHPPVTFAYDSYHFLQNLRIVVQFCLESLHGHMHPKLLSAPDFVQSIRLDGPVLAAFFTAPFLLLGKVPAVSDAKVFIFINCVFQAIDVFLIWLLCFRLSFNRVAAGLAALCFIIYPPALLQTERFLTEPFVTPLLLGFALLISQAQLGFWKALVTGVIAGTIFMAKSALILPIVLATIIRLLGWIFGADLNWHARAQLNGQVNWARYIKFILGMAVGFILVIAPWAVFTQTNMGTTLLTADREPALNIALGFDRETEGLPAILRGPFCRTVVDLSAPWQCAAGLFKAHPFEYLGFFAEKAVRLIIHPWNDFKDTVFGLIAGQQYILHLIFLTVAFFGIACCLLQVTQPVPSTAIVAAIYLSLIFGHGIYSVVQPNPRYMITCIPFLAIFVGLGLWTFVSALKDAGRRVILPVSIACGVMLVLLVSNHLTSFEGTERAIRLGTGESIVREIDLAELKVPVTLDTVLLLVDGSDLSSDTKVLVNGEELPDRFLPVYEFDPSFYSGTARDSLITMAAKCLLPSYASFRQWSAVFVPRNLLLPGKNHLALVERHGLATVYADPPGDWRHIPTLELCGLEKIINNPLRLDGRFRDPVACAQTWNDERFTLRNHDGITRTIDENVRLKLLFAEAINDPQTMKTRFVIPGDRFGFQSQSKPTGEITIDSSHQVSSRFVFAKTPLAGNYYVKVTGEAKRLAGGTTACIRAKVVDSRGGLRFAEMPASLTLANDWQEFSAEGVVLTCDMSSIKSVDVQCLPKDWNLIRAYGLKRGCSTAAVRNLKVTIAPALIPACSFERRVIM